MLLDYLQARDEGRILQNYNIDGGKIMLFLLDKLVWNIDAC